MFGGNRLYKLAVGGWLGILIGFPALAQEDAPTVLESQPLPEVQESADHERAERERQREREPAIDLTPALNQIESAIRDLVKQQRSVQTQDPAEHEIEDLEAQKDMANWAKAMFVATAVATFLTAIGVFLIWCTLHHTAKAAEYTKGMLGEAEKTTKAAETAACEARRQVDIAERAAAQARKSFFIENRPWMDFEKVHGVKLHKSQSPPRIDMKLYAKNMGKSPAGNVGFIAWVVGESHQVDYSELQGMAEEQITKRVNTSKITEQMTRPDGLATDSVSAEIPSRMRGDNTHSIIVQYIVYYKPVIFESDIYFYTAEYGSVRLNDGSFTANSQSTIIV